MIIREFAISNFRSLKNIRISQFNPITLLHGDNDVGKSNILTALEIIFQSKAHISTIALSSGKTEQRSILGFWEGQLENFKDNFYRDSTEPIEFHVTIRFEPKELEVVINSTEFAEKTCKGSGNPDDLKIGGEIIRLDQGQIYQRLKNVRINNKVIYERTNDGEIKYFPHLEEISDGEKYVIFERILSTLNDLFTLVSSRRYLTTETDMKGSECNLEPTTFKNWLYNLQMNRDSYSEYEEIKRLFSEPPFKFGDISFAREKDKLEIFVKRNDLRLPIGRLGTGVQQILYLLANIIHNEGKVVGLEEMEINLSEYSQNLMLGILEDLIKSGKSTIRQVIMTSHSYDYGKKGQVLRWWVSHNGKETAVKPWDNEGEAFLLRMRIGRLIGTFSDEEIRDIFLKACSKDEIKEIMKKVFTSEEIKQILGV